MELQYDIKSVFDEYVVGEHTVDAMVADLEDLFKAKVEQAIDEVAWEASFGAMPMGQNELLECIKEKLC
jgi:hypothetical protein